MEVYICWGGKSIFVCQALQTDMKALKIRKLTKIMLPEVGVGNLKIRPRGDNRCESANYAFAARSLAVKESLAQQH